MQDKLIIFIKYYFPALLWAGAIFYFSGVPDLKTGSGSLFREIVLRKGAHVGEYVVLFWLIFRIFYGAHQYEFRDSAIATVFWGSLWAVSDEFHQMFVFGRSGKLLDVAVDVLGGILGLQIVSVIYRLSLSLKKTLYFLFVSFGLVVLVTLSYQDGKMEGDYQRSLTLAQLEKENTNLEKNLENSPSSDVSNSSEKETTPPNISPTDLPKKVLIDVPFTSQAPHANWDAYHEEACEEASLIMVKHFLGKTRLNPDSADKEILDMVDFEIKKYGNYVDSSAKEMVELAEDYYGDLPGGKKLRVVYNIKRQDIKDYLAKGNPVIVPAAGRRLGNPNYSGLGPLYHVLVATGYEGDEIITNDPGTRKGKGYRYNINVFYNAIHDFPGDKNNIEQGQKAMIVVE